jgi:hypothetical protein
MIRTISIVTFVIAGLLAPVHAEDAMSPDSLIEQLMQLPPAEIAGHINALKAQVTALESESKTLKDKAVGLDQQRKTAESQILPYQNFMKAMAPKPKPKTEIIMAVEKNINFLDDILPIFEARCFKCHRDDKREGGLTMSTFSNMMAGGSSGEVVLAAGNPDGSRLFQMVLQEIDPIMPPRGKPLDDDQLDLIQKWIESGMRERSDSKIKLAKAEKKEANPIFIAAAISDGPPPMPEVELAAYKTETIRPHAARALAVSPTSTLMAIGGDQQILLYNLEDFTLLGVLPFEEGEIYTIKFSVNGEMLFAGGGREGDTAAAVLYDVRTSKRVGTYGRGYDTILSGDISPDHAMLAIGGPDRKVRVYDTADGELLYELSPHTDWIYAIRFSPDGELLSTADRQGGLFFWQAANGREVGPMKGHNKAINDMAYTYDSNLMATAGDEGEIIIWDTWKYKQVRKIKAHTGRVLSLDYRKDGQLVSSGEDGLTKRWGADGKAVSSYEKLTDWAYQARFANEGSLVLGTDWHGTIAVWNTDKGERVASLSTRPETPAPAKVAKSTD